MKENVDLCQAPYFALNCFLIGALTKTFKKRWEPAKLLAQLNTYSSFMLLLKTRQSLTKQKSIASKS